MKRTLSLLLSAALALSLLTACGDTAPEDQSSAASASQSSSAASSQTPGQSVPEEPAPPAIPCLDRLKGTAVPDFLTPELQSLYLQAVNAAQFLMGTGSFQVEEFPLEDGTLPDLSGEPEFVVINDLPYNVVRGRFARWEDFQAALDALFTRDYWQSLIDCDPERVPPMFTADDEGRTLYLDGARGANYFYDGTPDTFEPVSETEDSITFNLIGHYTDIVTDENGNDTEGEHYTEEFPIRLVRTESGWRFEEFHLPY